MGGLKKSMPWTFWTFLVGSLALAGVFPFSGFFSKDMILVKVHEHSTVLFVTALAAAFCTAFYMGRAIIVTFLGAARSKGHPHEVPWVMRGPLVILAAMSVLPSLWVAGFAEFVHFGAAEPEHLDVAFAATTSLIPLAGIGLAWAMYGAGVLDPAAMARRFGPLYTLLKRRYYVDELYNWIIDELVMRLSAALAWFDRHVVDGAVNGVAWLSQKAGGRLRRLQTGNVQHYAFAVFGGVVLLLIIARMAGAR